MNDQNKETAIQNEQQSKTKQEIINDVIDILAANKLTITDAKDILYATSKELSKQEVKASS
jgi:predicted nucleic-acid-binding protein